MKIETCSKKFGFFKINMYEWFLVLNKLQYLISYFYFGDLLVTY